jgi:quercetin dioxygenase-like cupin family protein
MYKKQIITLAALITIALGWGMSVVWAQVVEPDEHDFMIAGPDDLHPAEGSRTVNVYGDPREEGLYVIQITWAPGTGSRPHYHDQARYINVLKGHWYVATGPEAAVYNPDETIRVGPGTFIYEPPNGIHYDMAKDEEVVVQIFGYGPVNTTSIPQD